MHGCYFGHRGSRLALGLLILGLSSGAAGASTLPDRRAGFWQTTMTPTMHMTVNGQVMDRTGQTMVTALCTDPATEALERKKLMSGGCMQSDFVADGNAYDIHGSCPGPHGAAMVSQGKITVDSDTQTEVDFTMTGSGMTIHMVGQSKWLGACPAGVAPGDMGMMQNGTFVKTGNVQNGASKP
ncbi:MAG: hypothetical protein B7Y73_06405 [Acidocella sp. 35-58-6]|nr:MAG: hypothetical protein B7Z77_07900 [Acidocella sp. 20-58-15]OYY03592.1 MAG: hypothetical protein B7Y73_06405 [Acidocella sp. 35-58-6]